ncbi:RNA polymerase sigma-70 factor [Chitinophaga silvatica]|uniref:RNA polymerase sigma-70 factor n=1 Tax=Chitinophaga silvatica TaxID=2282649 RepID=A0A3E1Y649_9BACT|nr:RNA polymerase sigma-70 factor [Chitinophaga silvatica]RFS20214.1 RNA polymerase sigma-70 factor [Chitinophaga silvatica]
MDVNNYNERALLQNLAAGDDQAFASVFHHYRQRLYAIAFKLLNSPSMAEDIVQDVFLKLWLRKKELHEIQHFKAYLFTITRNHIFNALKKMAREQPIETDCYTDHIIDSTSSYKEYEKILQHAISKLPPQQELIYKLSKEEGLKRHEIADKLHLSPETIKVHLAHAMRNIRAFCLTHMDLNIFLLLFFFYQD